MNSHEIQRRPAASHLAAAAAGSARDAYAFVDWLAAAGQSWWQMLPLGPPDRHGSPYKSRSAFAAWPGLLAEPEAPVTRAEARRVPRARRVWIGAGRASPARDARRPGALRARVGRAARATPPSAACGSSATCRSTSRPGAPTTARTRSCSSTASSRARRPTPTPTRASCGATRSTTGRRCAGAATAGGSSACGARSSSSTSRGSTTSAASSPTGWCREGARDAAAGAGAAGPGARAVRRGAERELGALPFIAEDLGVITAPVDRLRATLGLPGHGRPAVRLRPRRPRTGRTASSNHERGPRRLHRHARQRHGCAAGGSRSPAATRARAHAASPRRRRGRRPGWALIRLALRSPARPGDVQAQDVLGLGIEARMNLPGRRGAVAVAAGARRS